MPDYLRLAVNRPAGDPEVMNRCLVGLRILFFGHSVRDELPKTLGQNRDSGSRESGQRERCNAARRSTREGNIAFVQLGNPVGSA